MAAQRPRHRCPGPATASVRPAASQRAKSSQNWAGYDAYGSNHHYFAAVHGYFIQSKLGPHACDPAGQEGSWIGLGGGYYGSSASLSSSLLQGGTAINGRHTGRPALVAALLALGTGAPVPSGALAAAAGDVTARVQRLLRPASPSPRARNVLALASVTALLAAAPGLLAWLAAPLAAHFVALPW